MTNEQFRKIVDTAISIEGLASLLASDLDANGANDDRNLLKISLSYKLLMDRIKNFTDEIDLLIP